MRHLNTVRKVSDDFRLNAGDILFNQGSRLSIHKERQLKPPFTFNAAANPH